MNVARDVYISYIWELCKSCARDIYASTPPNERYAASVADLLFGTIAHESDSFRATRQYRFSYASTRGAFGLCQVEMGSVIDSSLLLERNANLHSNAARWATGVSDADLEFFLRAPVLQRLQMICFSEELAVLFCRLHYLRVPSAIPATLNEQAAYYKRHYNTMLGKAKPSDFINALNRAKAEIRR